MKPLLSRKVIVIIGGTTGLGLSAAQACLRAGACVVVLGLDRSSAMSARRILGKKARVVVGDATVSGTAEKAIKLAVSEFGGFHGLYHVAGGSGRRKGDGPLHELSDEGWEYTLKLNLTSVMLSNRAAVQAFQRAGTGGSILNLASVLGFSPSPDFFGTQAYATAKSAIIGFTRSAAAAYVKENIRFNVLAPGLVATPMSVRAQDNPKIMQFIKN
ncbi:MAG TPA: SDR family oxidoreductase, partial [Roseimicrobium sp.]|nr:SDR family oxidoreductase [Roseimicrobium sp.]